MLRLFFKSVAILFLCSVLLAFLWQPKTLQRQAVGYAIAMIKAHTPYRLSLRDVSGNFFRHFYLHDVELREAEKNTLLLQAEKLQLRIRWSALLLKRLGFRAILFLPKGSGDFELRGSFGLDKPHRTRLRFETNNFPLQNLFKTAMAVPPELHLTHTGSGTLEGSELSWSLTAEGRLEDAPLKLSADILTSGPYRAKVQYDALSLERVWRKPQMKFFGDSSAALDLSGDTLTSKAVNAEGYLQLARGKTPYLRADLALKKGKGHVLGRAQGEGLQGNTTAQLDLPGERIDSRFHFLLSRFDRLAEFAPALAQAQGTLSAQGTAKGSLHALHVDATLDGQKLAFQDRRVEHINAAVKGQMATRKLPAVQMTLTKLDWSVEEEGPWDIEKADLTLAPKPGEWQSSANAEFRNKAKVKFAGRILPSPPEGWEIRWQELVLTPSKGPAFTNTQTGSALFFPKRPSLDIRELALSDGGKGTFALDFTLAGRYPNVSLRGRLASELTPAFLNQGGLDVRGLSLEIVAVDKSIEIRKGLLRTRKGDLRLSGKSTLPALNFTLEGQKVALDWTKRFEAISDVRLAVSGTLASPSITGEASVQEATYTADQKKKKAEKKASTEPNRLWENTAIDFHTVWPRSGWYRDGLSKIETSGDLRLEKEKGLRNPYITGKISIVRGTYDAYGRDFLVDSGDIIFTGPPEINPQLNIPARYETGGTIVYMDIKGTAKKPEWSMRSNPPLSEQDIVSVLVFGQPLNQVGGTGSNSNRNAQAQALVGSVIGGYLTRGLRQSGMDFLNLDVVRVEPAATGNRLTVGRYIGRKLFISYGQPLQSTANRVFNADYYLSKRWTLQGRTGSAQDSYMDMLFRYPLNAK